MQASVNKSHMDFDSSWSATCHGLGPWARNMPLDLSLSSGHCEHCAGVSHCLVLPMALGIIRAAETAVSLIKSRSSLQWRHNERYGISTYQPRHCLLNRLFMRRSKKTSKLRVTGLWTGNSPVTGEFPTQMASNAENVSIWWRHHVFSA